MPTTLYVATTNPGKLREFAASAARHGFLVEPLPDLHDLPAPTEDAPTFAGNAALKVRAYSLARPGLLVLSDDSGLEVEALGGRPGVLSARFADALNFEPGSSLDRDARNNRCLLSLLADVNTATEGRAGRGSRFVCALALARDGDILLRAEGTLEGDIAQTPRGENGFGYDALFLLRNRGLTLAELPPEGKWAISHRGHAFRDLLRQVDQLPPANASKSQF